MFCGDTLKNGAEILIRAPKKGEFDRWIVLCRWENDVDPALVCWLIDEHGHAFWGAYHNEAIPAFCKRTGYSESGVRRYLEYLNVPL